MPLSVEYWDLLEYVHALYVCREVLFCREPLDIAIESLSIWQFDAVSYLFLFECIYYYSKVKHELFWYLSLSHYEGLYLLLAMLKIN